MHLTHVISIRVNYETLKMPRDPLRQLFTIKAVKAGERKDRYVRTKQANRM